MLIALLTTLAAGQAVPVRDRPATPPAATAVVRGRVTSAETREPLHRVRVTLNGLAQLPAGVTNTRGEFEITEVPAGIYTLSMARSGYLTVLYGQRNPGDSGRTIEIKSGAVVEGIDVAMVRGGVLAGTITDDTGGEFPGVRVEATEFRYIKGRRLLVQAGIATTNDLGQFRLAGLAPGSYVLRASTNDTWESDDGTIGYAYAITFYPGVTASTDAETLTLRAGQELMPLNFSLRPGRAARISGSFQNAAGEGQTSQTISLSLITRGIGGAPFSSQAAGSARSDHNGGFEFRNLASGEYMLSSGGDAERASVTVVVGDGDDRSVILRPNKPTVVSGTIVPDGDVALPLSPGRIAIDAVSTDPDSVFRGFTDPGPAAVNRDWSFRFANLSGQYIFRAGGLPGDWMLTRVVVGDRDVTDLPLVIPPGSPAITGLRVAVSDKGARVNGQVRNADGAPNANSVVVIFSADRSRWAFPSRFVRTVRPDGDGRFSIGGLVPGAYRAVAREFVINGQSEDPAFLATLVQFATEFDAVAGDTATLTLSVRATR
ncbi:MAG: carboxypeptidase regulatory-like domain-containing protein [Vicinamibacterales bacterium]|nr:carboxypeptidase regulatory-like domain-containing protein [Vicinamibacterales bacterium]